MNETVVYWASTFFPLESLEPDNAILDLKNKISLMNKETPFLSSHLGRCPAVVDNLNNTFRIKSPINYDIEWDGNNYFKSNSLDQEFFLKNVIPRDGKTGFLSLNLGSTIFYTEESSLKMEQRQAVYSQSFFSKNISMIEGNYDIGKWFRPLDVAMFINRPEFNLKIERGDTLFYVKFYSKNNIKLVKFKKNEELDQIIRNIHKSRRFVEKSNIITKLEFYYQFLQQSRYKSFILKQIKQNLME